MNEVSTINEWVKTDDLQWVKQTSENEFEVVGITLYEDYTLYEMDVNLSEYSEEDMEKELDGYYDSLEEAKKRYPNSWKQIVAEAIAENEATNSRSDVNFTSLEEVYKNLKEYYHIEIEEENN